MSPNPTYVSKAAPDARDIIDIRRRFQSRGNAVLRPGETIAFLPYREMSFRVRYISPDELDVDGCYGPLPGHYDLCEQLSLPWKHLATVNHRWPNPSFDWTAEVRDPWVDEQGCTHLTTKILNAYYHVIKGYGIDPADEALINPEPCWISAAASTT